MAFDLDDEELKATRKLLGIDKENNMKGYSIQNGEPTPDNPVEIESLDIEERKQDKARIQELEEILLKVKDKNVKLFIHYKNSIPKQKVKDTLTEIQKEYEKLDKASDDFLNNKEKTAEDYVLEKERLATMQTLAYCRDNLEELLEEK